MDERRIHVINRYVFPVRTSGETVLNEVFSRFAAAGWEVTVHASCDSPSRRNVYPPGPDVYRGMRIRRYWHHPFIGYVPRIPWRAADVVQLNGVGIFPHAWVLARAAVLKFWNRKKFLLLLAPHMELSHDAYAETVHLRFIKRFYYGTLGRRLINYAVDGIRALNDMERERLMDLGIKGELIRTLPNGVAAEAFLDPDAAVKPLVRETVRSGGRYIVQVGRVHPVKNYEAVIRALPYLPADVLFYIVGPNMMPEYRRELERIAAGSNVQFRIRFFGELSAGDKFYVLKHAQAMVHCAREEAHSLAILEGMSQKLPVVIADRPDLSALVRNNVNGYIADDSDPRALARAIMRILQPSDGTVADRMRKANYQLALDREWGNVFQAMEKWYRERRLSRLAV